MYVFYERVEKVGLDIFCHNFNNVGFTNLIRYCVNRTVDAILNRNIIFILDISKSFVHKCIRIFFGYLFEVLK